METKEQFNYICLTYKDVCMDYPFREWQMDCRPYQGYGLGICLDMYRQGGQVCINPEKCA